MKVLSLWQPYATAISLSLKTIETRSFSTNYRGPLAIQATKHSPVESLELSVEDPVIRRALLEKCLRFREAFAQGIPRPWRIFPAGALLCVTELIDCCPTFSSRANVAVFSRHPKRLNPQELAFGNYVPGRYGWVLDKIQPLPSPIPYSGHQGLRDLDPDTEKRVMAALKGKV
jgi:activating signal cointegrator 1